MRFATLTSLLVSALVLLQACVSRAVLPGDLELYESSFEGLGAAPLWSADAHSTYLRRVRLTITPNFSSGARISIEINQDNSEQTTGRIVQAERAGGRWRVTERRRFRLDQEEAERFNSALAESDLWTVNFEHWEISDPDVICLDGVLGILEKVTAEGYRFSEANFQCTAPPDFRALSLLMIELANPRRNDVASWLN